MIDWNEEDERNVTMFRLRNVRYLNLKNGRITVANKENVLEQFCRKNGLQEQKENWRQQIETEIELKEMEVEELKKKKKQARSKKKKLEIFKEFRTKLSSMIIDWKETPGRDEEKSYGMWKEICMTERMDKNGLSVENIRNVDAVVVDIVDIVEDDRKKDDSLLFGSLCLKKKTEEKKTITPNCNNVAQQIDLKAKITMDEPTALCNFIGRKLQNKEAAKVSGQKTNILLSKPHQQVHLSVGIKDQTIPGCTGPFN